MGPPTQRMLMTVPGAPHSGISKVYYSREMCVVTSFSIIGVLVTTVPSGALITPPTQIQQHPPKNNTVQQGVLIIIYL